LFLSVERFVQKTGEVQPVVLPAMSPCRVARSGCHLFTNPPKSSQKLQLSVLSIHTQLLLDSPYAAPLSPSVSTLSPAYGIPFQ